MQNSRVIICEDGHFPRGDAGANRIQYLAMALIEAQKEVVIVSYDKSDASTVYKDGFSHYLGIPYLNAKIGNNLVLKKVGEKIFGGKNVLRVLKFLSPSSDDVVIIYGSNSLFVSPILSYCRRKKIKSVIDVVEWHQPFQYEGGYTSIRYRSAKHTFEVLAKKADSVIAISSVIKKYYTDNGCRAEIFPPMTDTSEQTPTEIVPFEIGIHIIYPGNPFNKDDIGVMLKGLTALPAHKLDHVYFHMTGVKEERLRKYLKEDQSVVDRLGKHLVMHGWMSYDELTNLYQKMDFLFLSRPDNLVTRANFPSKLPELMGWGIVPICIRVGDYYTYLDDGKNALLFDDNTSECSLKAVMRAVELTIDKRAEMSREARLCAEMHFDYRCWSSSLADFIFGYIHEKE
jgi:glycosyltransferase involved in cell wall biosynthesis